MVDKNSVYRPVPHFFNDNLFLSKKATSSTPFKKKVPPRPPSKSLPTKSRLFSNPRLSRAQAISFKDDFSTLSKDYDETRTESYFQQCFRIEEKIGSGSFGDVFKCLSKDDGKYYAIKKSRERYKGKSDRETKLQEVNKHEQLPKHPNLVQFYKAWEENGHLYIQIELCECNLTEYLEHNEISQEMIWNFLADLLSATKHLHDRDLIHLDIKPDNIFLSKDGLFKLGDFGLVVEASDIDLSKVTEGDPKYLAKEVLQLVFTKAADIFSLGITTMELACDIELPGRGEGWHPLREGRMPSIFFNKLSPELQKVILGMMHPDYRLRWTADELLSYPPISKVIWKRRIKTKVRSCWNFIVDYFHWLFTLLFKILFISTLVSWIKENFSEPSAVRPQTPPLINRTSPFDWDQSFSDEETLDDSFYLPPANEDMNLSFLSIRPSLNDLSINNINTYHSTANRAKHPQIGTPLPKMTPLGKRNTQNMDKSLFKANSRVADQSSLSFSERPSFCDLSDDEDDINISTNNFGPKNLLDLFEKIEDEPENAF